MARVSVVVPAHNHAKYLPVTIRSVLDQTFTDFELILIDNGSTDNTHEVVQRFDDPRIRYFYQKDSGLPANSRNVGINMSRGEWIALLDSDDIWLPNKLATQMRYADEIPTAFFICTNAIYFSEQQEM